MSSRTTNTPSHPVAQLTRLAARLDALTLKAAKLDTGTPISPGQARRMACQAGIIPMVLGGPSEILDVGCKQRFHTEAMRMAMLVRDQGCATHGCEPQRHHQPPPARVRRRGGLAQGRLA
jgi:hypothetical protein